MIAGPVLRGKVCRPVDASSRLHRVEVLEHVDGAPAKHLLARDDATGCDAPKKPKDNNAEQDSPLAFKEQRTAARRRHTPRGATPLAVQDLPERSSKEEDNVLPIMASCGGENAPKFPPKCQRGEGKHNATKRQNKQTLTEMVLLAWRSAGKAT